MSLTLLQIIQAAQAELGLPQASSVVGNTDPTTTQMFALSNRVIDAIRRASRWVNLQFEFNLVVNPPVDDVGNDLGWLAQYHHWTAAQHDCGTRRPAICVGRRSELRSCSGACPVGERHDQSSWIWRPQRPSTNMSVQFGQDTYAMPTGFDWFNNRTMWDRTNRWELLGPDSPQMDQWHRSGIVVTGPRRHFRKIGPYANIFPSVARTVRVGQPNPARLRIYQHRCRLRQWQRKHSAQYFANDDDQPILDDQSVVMGIKWMFWQAKGFNYADMKNDWIDYVDRNIARDGAAPTLNLVKRQSIRFYFAQQRAGRLFSRSSWA